jgi:hypothetical protein
MTGLNWHDAILIAAVIVTVLALWSIDNMKD